MSNPLPPTLFILNPRAGSGQAGRLWPQLEPIVKKEFGDVQVAITQTPNEVMRHLEEAQKQGIQRVIALGGDGTNHFMVNILQKFATDNPDAPQFTYGQIPMGTGRDFCRTLGTPLAPIDAIHWLAKAQPQAIDIGHLTIDESQSHYFLNISSAGIGGNIAQRVNSIQKRRFWTFHLQSLLALVTYQPRHLKVLLDGEVWYDAKSWVIAIANGQYFGNNMNVAPHASLTDGLFDVVMVENSARLNLMIALNSLYTAEHLKRDDVFSKRAREVIVETQDKDLALEMDGETHTGRHLKYTIQPAALSMLTHEVS